MQSSASDRWQVTTVFSATQHSRAGRSVPMRVLGLLTLAVCAGWSYAVWWPVDNQLIRMTNSYGLNVVLGQARAQSGGGRAAGPLGDLFIALAGHGPATESAPVEQPAKPDDLENSYQAVRRRGTAFAASFYGWYLLMTLAASVAAAAGGAAFCGRFPGRRVRLCGLALTLLSLTALGAFGVVIYRQYGTAWPVWSPRYAVVLGLVACLGAGVLATGGGRGMHRAAAIVMLLSAGGTALALYVATQYGGLHDPVLNRGLYARALALQSAYPIAVLLALKIIRL